MTIKLIIWDLDGVLIDSLEVSMKNFLEVINPYLEEPITKNEIYEKYLGATEEQDVLKLAISKGIEKSKLSEIQSAFIEIKQKNLQRIKMFRDINKIILYARSIGIKQVLITGRDTNSAKIILENEYTKINGESPIEYFDYFLGGDKYPGKLKAFDLMLKKFRMQPNNALVLGDEIKDIIVARQLGCIEGACLWGSFVKKELKNMNPTFLFKTPSELMNFLQNS